jgi:hypothetical protein
MLSTLTSPHEPSDMGINTQNFSMPARKSVTESLQSSVSYDGVSNHLQPSEKPTSRARRGLETTKKLFNDFMVSKPLRQKGHTPPAMQSQEKFNAGENNVPGTSRLGESRGEIPTAPEERAIPDRSRTPYSYSVHKKEDLSSKRRSVSPQQQEIIGPSKPQFPPLVQKGRISPQKSQTLDSHSVNEEDEFPWFGSVVEQETTGPNEPQYTLPVQQKTTIPTKILSPPSSSQQRTVLNTSRSVLSPQQKIPTSMEPKSPPPVQLKSDIPATSETRPITEQRYHIFVKMRDRERIVLSVEESDTLSGIKIAIQEKEGIPTNQQRLVFAGRLLEHDNTLEFYNIVPNATVYLALTVKEPTGSILVKTLTGKTIHINASPEETVYSIKSKIAAKEGIPEGDQHLIAAESQLQDHLTLKDYGIPIGSVIHLVLRLKGT